jgi:hypothetical protein
MAMNRFFVLAASTLLLSTASAQVPPTCITTPPNFVSNNGGSAGGGVYFDIEVFNPNGISIKSLELNLWQATVLDPFTVDVYTLDGGGTGEGNVLTGSYTLVSTGSDLVQAQDTPSPVDIDDFTLAPGVHSLALILTGAGHRYTNGSSGLPWGSGGNQVIGNADLEIRLGGGSNAPFGPGIFQPRVWNGTICYREGSECFLLVGLQQWNYMLGSDAILVEPMLVIPMTLSTAPVLPLPNNSGLVGLSVYVQSFLYNPWYYPNDPIQTSDGLDFKIGTSTTPYGPTNTILMWPAGSIIAQPGGAIEIGFALP